MRHKPVTSDWKLYQPAVEGQPPRGWDPDTMEFEIQWRSGEEFEAINEPPEWLPEFNYRYRSLPGAGSNSMPEDSDLREQFPMADGLLDYFPNALAEVSKVSKIGNEKHNPGQPMHWSRGKSTDHRNKIMRHLIDAGGKDSYGVRHSAYLAWRALANLQEELERDEGYPMSRASKAGPEDGPTRQ